MPGTPCRAAVPLRYAKQAEDPPSPSAIPPARSGTREKFSRHSRTFLAGSLDSLEGGSTLERQRRRDVYRPTITRHPRSVHTRYFARPTVSRA